MEFRSVLKQTDTSYLKEILDSAGFFYDYEVDIAIELAQENIDKGEEKSGYIFLIVEENGTPVAFACYGKNPGTIDSYDLYWIAVHKNQRGNGIGKIIMKKVEEHVKQLKGKKLWIETSSRELYNPTREFYLKTDCELVAELPDYYGDGDSKCVFLKKL